jgi:hypothetical protein
MLAFYFALKARKSAGGDVMDEKESHDVLSYKATD